MNALLTIRSTFGRILTVCGWIAGIVTFAVMCLVVANVVSRYVLNRPIAGTLELTEGALPLIIFLGVALTQFHGGHIRVTIFTDRLPLSLARALSVVALVLGALLFAWAAYAGWIFAERSFAMGEMKRGSIRFAIWPIKFAVCGGLALLAIQFAIDAVCVAVGMERREPDAEEVQ